MSYTITESLKYFANNGFGIVVTNTDTYDLASKDKHPDHTIHLINVSGYKRDSLEMKGAAALFNLMEDAATFELKIILIGIISLVCLLTYVILFSSTAISKMLGETGNNVLMRLMGLILMVIAVEFFLSD